MHSTSAAVAAEPMPYDEGEQANGADPHEAMQERMAAFVARLSDEANRRVQKRYHVEQRWILDLQQYHGVYEHDTLRKLVQANVSQVFINLTATKTDAMEARLWDLLFPTDDKNWGIEPTPVPELTEGAEAALQKVDEAIQAGDQAQAEAQQLMAEGNLEGAQAAEGRMRQAEAQQNAAQKAADDLHDILNEAKRRAKLMSEEIHDQLAQCRHPAQARDVIGDACKLGLGVMKGPVLNDKGKQRWSRQEQQGPDGASVVAHVLETVTDTAPGAYRVDPWSFFPDPDVRRIEDGSGNYERHLTSKDGLRKMARRPDMDKDAIRKLLKEGPQGGSTPAYMADLHDLTGQTDGDIRDQYQVWEYTGPVETEDMELLLQAFSEDDAELEELDPLTEYHVRIWFCQGKLLSFALHPLDSNEPLYSVFTIRPDEASVFGFGIPYIMRHPQSVLNGAYRMMMDNSGLSTGPQIVVNKAVVRPEDGKWQVAPRKVWLRDNSASQPGVPAFEAFNIPSNQAELANIIQIASGTIDEVTAQPAIAQGEQGAGVTKTAQGMALLMNSANVSFRRIVKNFDDDITTPIIRRFYHWNMQFSDKEEIKGDYEVVARGSGVLLVREMQAQNLVMIAQMFGDHPVYGPMLKHRELLQVIFRAHMVQADEITKTERELKQFIADKQEQVDPQTAALQAQNALREKELELRQVELDQKAELANMEWDMRLKIAKLTYDSQMEKVAGALNMKREELDAKLRGMDADNAHRERSLAVEAAMRERTGVSAGGAI